jgi:uncharacterized protein YjbI with pentapeptide repeats
MRDVDAEGASFKNSNLSGACFRNANLQRADFSRANLSEANLLKAYIKDAIWDYADMGFRLVDGAEPEEEMLAALEQWKARVDAKYESFCRTLAKGTEFPEKELDKPEEDGI